MSPNAAISLLLLTAIVLANESFFSQRFLWIGPSKKQHPWLQVLELLLAYAAFVFLGMGLETFVGQHSPQAWQFYAVSLCLFLTMAFPGFVWRYLLKRKSAH